MVGLTSAVLVPVMLSERWPGCSSTGRHADLMRMTPTLSWCVCVCEHACVRARVCKRTQSSLRVWCSFQSVNAFCVREIQYEHWPTHQPNDDDQMRMTFGHFPTITPTLTLHVTQHLASSSLSNAIANGYDQYLIVFILHRQLSTHFRNNIYLYGHVIFFVWKTTCWGLSATSTIQSLPPPPLSPWSPNSVPHHSPYFWRFPQNISIGLLWSWM
jgi:hypothetical protein